MLTNYLSNIFLLLTLIIFTGDSIGKKKVNKCILPKYPSHGLWSVVAGTNSPYTAPGFEVPAGTALNVQCQSGYTLQGSSFIICTDKVWSSEIGKCLPQCPPITSTATTKVTCINPSDEEEAEDCTSPENGTTAKFKCAQFYESPEIDKTPVLECQNGQWNHTIPQCTPVCGVKSVSAQPLIVGGSFAKTTDYPWHVGVYEQLIPGDSTYSLTCSANLVNERVILTVAHCVSDYETFQPKPVEKLLVAAGKYYRDLDDPRDAHKQISNVQQIYIADTFKGLTANFVGDIAIVIPVKTFILTKYVLPICIDWSLTYENLFTARKVNGSVSGWGITKPGKGPSDELKELHVPFVPYDECSRNLNYIYDTYFTNDKMCVGYRNKSMSICHGDGGGGLVFRNTDSRYYLAGIVSISPTSPGGGCDTQLYTLYTKISSYTTNFIFETERKYRPYNLTTYFGVEIGNISEPIVVISKSREVCGLKSTEAETLIVSGKNTTKGDYPWQIAIYDTTKKKQLICGGSLIHQRIILTAAHCVTDQYTNELNPKEQYSLAAGKYFRNFNDPRDTDVQHSLVREMFVPPQYEGDRQNYMGDIAILISEVKFIFSKFIQPVCIDWDNKYESEVTKSSVKGFVSGWGNTVESGDPSDVLKDISVPYVDRHQCKRELPVDYDIYLTFDKICSGYLNKNISVCKGDSGGGLVFRIPEANRYYITGIVSLSPRAPTAMGGCDSQQYALYTRVSHYITSFILAKVRLFL